MARTKLRRNPQYRGESIVKPSGRSNKNLGKRRGSS